MIMLNVEERNLLILFDTGSRDKTIEELKESMEQVSDPELAEICQHVLDKLTGMSDEEYAALGLSMEEVAYDE